MKVVALVQARMGSTRLPNKVMKPIGGIPMIELLLSRLSQSKEVAQIVVATSVDDRNQPLVEHVRKLGYVWVTAMALAAIITFDMRLINHGRFSIIHILSVWTLIQLPIIVLSARAHNHARHRRSVRGMLIGALLIAGFFTFPFERMLGKWLFG